MTKTIEKQPQNKVLIVILLSLLSLTLALISFSMYEKESSLTIAERNYKAEVLMKLSPNMETRIPNQKDIDTQLNLKDSLGNTYRLFESRDMISYGKTFVVRTN